MLVSIARGVSCASKSSVTAASADHQPLKQRRSFPWGTVATILSMRLAIGAQLGEIGFIVFPTDVASRYTLNEKQPLLLGKGFDVEGAISMFGSMGASEAEGTGVARIAQHFEDRIVLQWHPMQLA